MKKNRRKYSYEKCLTKYLYLEYANNLKFTNKMTSRIFKWTKDLKRQVTNEDVQMTSGPVTYMKSSTSLAVGEI